FRRIPVSRLSRIGNIGDYLDASILDVVEMDEDRRELEERVFKSTFDLLLASGGSLMMRRWNADKGRSEGPFSLAAFEIMALGIGHENAASRFDSKLVNEKLSEIWSSR